MGYCGLNIEINESDKLEKDSVAYDVKSVQEFDFGSVAHKKLLLERVKSS